MGLNCGCPVGESIPTISKQECKSSFGQIQKLLFQRKYTASGGQKVLNKISEDDLGSLTAMQSLLAATDSTKVAVSPEINNPEVEPGAARTFGGNDNTTLGGMAIITGREPTTFTAAYYELDQAIIKQLKELQCEDVTVYFIDEYGNIGCLDAGVTGTAPSTVQNYRGVPIRSLFIGDKKFGGFSDPDSNAISFSLEPNWSDDLVVVKRDELDYDPLTAL